MRKILTILLLAFISFQVAGMSTMATSSYCANLECTTTIFGTSFDNNVLSKKYKNDVKAKFTGVDLVNGYIEMDINLKTSKQQYNFTLMGNIYYDDINDIYFFDLVSNDKTVEVKSFYIEKEVDNRLLNERNKNLINSDILRIAVEVNGNIFYFENEVGSVFKYVIEIPDELLDFNEIKKNQSDLVAKFGSMMKWFMYYPRVTNDDSQDEISIKGVNELEPIDDDGGNPPTRIGNIPDYLYDRYYIFWIEGEGMYYSGDYLFYRVTYPNFMGYTDAYITYTVEMELIRTLPGDTRSGLEWTGEIGLTLSIIQQKHYVYYGSTNEIREYMEYESFRIKNLEMIFNIEEEDLAWRETSFFGHADKTGLWKKIKIASRYIPYIGGPLNLSWEYFETKLDDSMTNDNIKVMDSYLTLQIDKDKIHTEIRGQAQEYWMQIPGHYLHLRGALVLKESISVEGYKNTKLKYQFDIYTYDAFGFWTDFLYNEADSIFITYYR